MKGVARRMERRAGDGQRAVCGSPLAAESGVSVGGGHS